MLKKLTDRLTKKSPDAGTKKTPRKSGKKKWIVAGILVVAVAGGAFYMQNQKKQARMASADAGNKNTAEVTKGDLISSLSSSGTISAKDTYEITSLVEGEVVEANFEEGDQVEKGQVLYRIDASSVNSQLSSSQNSLERANKKYQEALDDYNEAVSDYSGDTYKSTRTGFIKSLNVEAGDKVSNNTVLASIYNDQTMKIKVPFLSTEAASIAEGAQAVVTLTDTGEQITGTVTAVSNMDEVLDGGRMVRYVTVEVENPGGLSSQYTATVAVGEFLGSGEATFSAATDTTMAASLSGVNGSVEIESMLVHEGDYVTAGTPIFKIKSKDVQDILQSFEDSVDSAKAQVEQAQSSLDSTQDNVDNYTITAPISGQIITKSVKVGDKITRNSGSSDTSLATIYDMSELTFEMSVDEMDISSVAVGQSVSVTADAYSDRTFSGTVTNVSLKGSQSNGVTNYPVTVTLDSDANGVLLPGMNVDGVITVGESKDALMVPSGALMRGNRVYVKDDSADTSNTPQKGGVPAGFKAVEVEVGLSNDDFVEIRSGVSEGDTVYVEESSGKSTDMFQMGGPGGGMGGPGGGPGGNSGGGGQRGGGGMP
ncbi:efflux RND transporter periplasmic adaptor subunit [Brotaphodocola sp.]|uniref:efflux RND transporter periplasmic adaptor subunit n=1 Tax=Brotaphodocola sp. TaxID=3073577 RepID=UPI003D7CAF6D